MAPDETAATCRHCHEPIEESTATTTVTRGKSWRHFMTGSVFCRRTIAEPESYPPLHEPEPPEPTDMSGSTTGADR